MPSNGAPPTDFESLLRQALKRIEALERRAPGAARATITGQGVPEYAPNGAPTYNLPTGPPDAAPTLTVSGSDLGLTVVAKGDVAQTTMLDYYLDGVLVTSTRSTVIFWTTDAVGNPMQKDTAYTWWVVAHNTFGGVQSAPATGMLNQDVKSEVIIGLISAGFVLAGKIKVGNITIDPDSGITIPQSNGATTYLRADGGGNSFAGQGVFDAATFYGGMDIRGLNNTQRGITTFIRGITNPSQRANVSTSYATALVTGVADYIKGLTSASSPGQWVTTNTTPTGSTINFLTPNGAPAAADVAVESGWRALGGITRIGGFYYVLARAISNISVYRVLAYRASDNQYVGSAYTDPANSSSLSVSALPAIGTDGTNVAISWSGNGTRYIRTYGAFDSGQWNTQVGSTIICGPDDLGESVAGVQKVGAYWFIINTSVVRAYTTAGVRAVAQEWPLGNSNDARGMWHNGSTWTGVFSDKLLTSYTNNAGAVDFAYAWYDSDPAGAGTAISLPSPRRSVTPTKFAQWRVTLPAAPDDRGGVDDANTAIIYAATAGGTLRQQYVLPQGVLAFTFDGLNLTTATPAETISGFAGRPTSSSGQLQSEVYDAAGPLWRVTADGSWRMGHLSGDSTGRNLNDTDWTDIVLDPAWTVSGFRPQYRVRDGVTSLRGQCYRMTGTGTVPFYLPPICGPALPSGDLYSFYIRVNVSWLPSAFTPSGGLLLSGTVANGDVVYLRSIASFPST